jgi:DNA-binding transcriptional ArsR family regulator
MTAVHWITTSGLYTPSRAHGPKWGTTTIAVAQEIAALKECRPGIAYLARKLRLSERTVQYHLDMLREAGLLVYRSKGTRLSGVGGRASVYERTIPSRFDEELGIRTVGEGATRRPVGIAERGRKLIGKLAKKAARKTRRRPSRTRASQRGRCTPMQVGTSTVSSTALTCFPSESKLASGAAEASPGKKTKRGPRTLNRVGRRHQLARELITLVPWLKGASVPRIAWIIRHVADAGWTALEVQAIAENERPIGADQVHRPSGLLANRLGSLHLLYTTPERRKTAVLAWQESRIQEKARHADTAGYSSFDGGPKSLAARRAMGEAFAAITNRLHGDAVLVDCTPIAFEDLSRDEVAAMRRDAMQDPGLVLAAIDLIGEQQTRRLYTHRLVDQTLTLERIAARNTTYDPAF